MNVIKVKESPSANRLLRARNHCTVKTRSRFSKTNKKGIAKAGHWAEQEPHCGSAWVPTATQVCVKYAQEVTDEMIKAKVLKGTHIDDTSFQEGHARR
jgi:hypothetical protein